MFGGNVKTCWIFEGNGDVWEIEVWVIFLGSEIMGKFSMQFMSLIQENAHNGHIDEVIGPGIFSALASWTFESSTVQDLHVLVGLLYWLDNYIPTNPQEIPWYHHFLWITYITTFSKSKFLLVKSPLTNSIDKSVVSPWKQHFCCYVIISTIIIPENHHEHPHHKKKNMQPPSNHHKTPI